MGKTKRHAWAELFFSENSRPNAHTSVNQTEHTTKIKMP